MTQPYYQDEHVTLLHGDCLDVLRELPDASVDAVVTDPPYGLGFMGKEWDSGKAFVERKTAKRNTFDHVGGNHNPANSADQQRTRLRENAAFGAWCELWAAECLRVLKPGGHMLAFGGSRTWHRLACAIEDAGFEIRDSIAWVHGQGFPKSLDVAKAITGAETGYGSNSSAIRRATMGEEYAPSGVRGNRDGVTRRSDTGMAGRDLPLTENAARWQGWGTALKPAFEPVVVARKPLGGPVSIRSRVEYELRQRGAEGEIQWTTRPASGAVSQSPMPTSGSTSQQPTAATSARNASASATQPTANATGSDTEKSTASGEPQTPTRSRPTGETPTGDSATPSSTPTAPTARAAAKPSRHSSRSTTSTAAAPSIESRYTERSTPNSAAKDSHPATESFVGIATGLSGSWATVRIDRLEDGTFVWPDGLPEMVTAGSTVAANVLAHGTGALNIDGCRIETTETLGRTNNVRNPESASSFLVGDGSGTFDRSDQAGGRWPTNVVLDDTQAAELDRQSGITKSKAANRGNLGAGPFSRLEGTGTLAGTDSVRGHDDEGGASRFFPVFRYEAKAPTAERPKYWAHDCDCPHDEAMRPGGTCETCGAPGKRIAHPTVKPLDLMRWLVRLVTPPGGTVLEPFAGSGTTAEACVIEGFRCIAIEREADYLPLIVARLTKPIQVTLDLDGGVA